MAKIEVIPPIDFDIPNYSVDIVKAVFDSKAINNAIAKIPSKVLNMSQTSLEEYSKPTVTDQLLRASLWHLVKKHYPKGEVKSKRIYENFCTYTHCHTGILGNPYKLSWILKPVWIRKLVLK